MSVIELSIITSKPNIATLSAQIDKHLLAQLALSRNIESAIIKPLA